MYYVEVEKNALPGIPTRNEFAWTLTGPPVNTTDLLSRRFRGGSVSLGELIVNLLEVVKRTNSPLTPQHNINIFGT